MANPTSNTWIIFSLVALLGLVQASAFDLFGSRTDLKDLSFNDYDPSPPLDEDGEERFLFTSTSSVTVNSTLLRAIGAIIGALLLALPLYLAYATHQGGKDTGYGHSGYHRRRMSRDVDDWATHMFMLMDSFRKYNIDDDECQLLVACQAAAQAEQEERVQDQSGGSRNKLTDLTSAVHRILSTTPLLRLRQDPGSEGRRYVTKLLAAHAKGQGQGQGHCQRLFPAAKTKCPAAA